MRSFFTRYSTSFPSSLVYMLQQSEYRSGDYLRWFWRTRNFKKVAKVRQLKLTSAAKGFLAFCWLGIALIWLSAAIYLYFELSHGQALAGLAGIFMISLAAPYILAYSLAVAAVLARIVVLAPQEKRRDARTRQTLAAHPAIKIAIAGSYGKTSMKEILTTVLEQSMKVAATPGNLNTPAGISRFVRNLQGDEAVLIFELGEYYPGDITALCQIVQPELGIITGINEAHLSKFRSLEATTSTIYELGDWLRAYNVESRTRNAEAPSPGANATLNVIHDTSYGSLLVNAESPLAAERAGTYNATTYSQNGVGEWQVKGAQTGLDGTSFKLYQGKNILNIHSKLLGLHQVGPLAAAAETAYQLGLRQTQIQQGLAATKPFEHRMEPKTDSSGVITIDDAYNGNPDGARVAIEFLSSLKSHKRFYVTPGITETAHRTQAVHETIGQLLAASGIEVVVLIQTSVMEHIKNGLTKGNFKGELLTYPDEISALVALPKLTKAGDVVLLQNDWPDAFA